MVWTGFVTSFRVGYGAFGTLLVTLQKLSTDNPSSIVPWVPGAGDTTENEHPLYGYHSFTQRERQKII